MPTNCTSTRKNQAALLHRMVIADFVIATAGYFGNTLVQPIVVDKDEIANLISGLDCETDCVIFTAKDSKTDNSLTWKIATKANRYNQVTHRYINDAASNEIQTTFSVTLLAYFVDKQQNFYFYKIRQGVDKGLAVSVATEVANHGYLGPDKAGMPIK